MQLKFKNKTTYITQYYKLVLQNIMLRDMVTLILGTQLSVIIITVFFNLIITFVASSTQPPHIPHSIAYLCEILHDRVTTKH